ncbi:glycosyltransferase [Pseudoxanthomonas spadix BD-a59]|uniref:Glycosyltransferase n=1 Tax=Pseudoxanthomonas spadix (strain BD-a59) TaxID=1045855 RepID=G7URS4_PSEUP|nr:glycosyltransferase family 39 protein [Pseudoxanthomonas spadix]AER55952.1 glycosyltransferase [Pseudoxanthomonas spadix BD-a59]
MAVTWQLPPRVVGVATNLLLTCALGALLAFSFLGSRGIWDPDEGRYSNVALTMLDTGDWLTPRRNSTIGHWTKPPGTYWMVAGSVALFGETPWAARLPIALSYLACMLLAGLCADRLFPGSGPVAAIAYATMSTPSVAGQLITTDFPLAASQALAMYAWLGRRAGDALYRHRWLLLMWAAFGIGFMIKGPPALLPLLAVGLAGMLCPAPGLRWRWHLSGIVVFLAIALPWYLMVAARNPGLLGYFLGAEVIDRVATDRFGRSGQWYGWLQVYVPVLTLGTLPWTGDLWRWLRQLPGHLRSWRARRQGSVDQQLLLALWILVPLLVFCLARSRMPLYLLPLFVPLAVAVAGQRLQAGRRFNWKWLGAWIVLLLAARAGGALWPTHKDASTWAEAIRARVHGPIHEVVFVEDMARYGLHLHLGTEIRKVSVMPVPAARFNPTYDGALQAELKQAERDPGLVFVVKQARYPEVERVIHAYGYAVHPWGSPFQGRVLFGVEPAADAAR